MNDHAPTKLSFQFIKNSNFKIIHADGATGGIAPRGNVFIAFYSERQPIPEVVTHHLTSEGILGSEIPEERKVKSAIIRDVEVGIMMDIPVAEALHVWLGQVLAERKKLGDPSGKEPR
jgi:hypothetical protein